MPLNLDTYDRRKVVEIMDALPVQVKTGTIDLYEGGPKFSFRWDKENEEHILIWKEPRRA